MTAATAAPASPQQASPPRTLVPVKRTQSYGRDTWYFGPEAIPYDDQALLTHCGYTPEFGGTVNRSLDGSRVTVTVFID